MTGSAFNAEVACLEEDVTFFGDLGALRAAHLHRANAAPWMAYSDAMDLFSGHCLDEKGAYRAADRPRIA